MPCRVWYMCWELFQIAWSLTVQALWRPVLRIRGRSLRRIFSLYIACRTQNQQWLDELLQQLHTIQPQAWYGSTHSTTLFPSWQMRIALFRPWSRLEQCSVRPQPQRNSCTKLTVALSTNMKLNDESSGWFEAWQALMHRFTFQDQADESSFTLKSEL